MSNFTLQDAMGSALAVAIFALALYIPGYILGYASNLFAFRRISFRQRTLWSLAYSFAATPVLSYLIGKYASLDTACGLLIGLALLWAVLIARERRQLTWSGIETVVLWIAGLWIVFVIVSLVDFQVGHKLYFSVVEDDQSYRVAFTNSVLRTGVPPANPLYFGGHFQPMRYYYFWYVVCAMVARIGHVSARQAFIAGNVWAGFGLVALLGLYVRHFLGVARNVRTHTAIAIGLIAVTGADLLPAIGSSIAQRALNGDMEWWSNDQISSWADSLLWVPHHVASLLCCMVAFLLLWMIQAKTDRRNRIGAIVGASVAFASAFGLSIYVAFAFALLMLAWTARLVVGRKSPSALHIGATAICSGLLLIPYIEELTTTQSRSEQSLHASAFHVLAFSVRRIIDPALLTALPAFAPLNHAHPALLNQCARILLLPLGLALELGFYGVVFWLYAAHRRSYPKDGPQRTALYLTGCGLVLALSVRSAVIGNNDFGYRAALLPQFFLLILASDLLGSWWIEGGHVTVIRTSARTRLLYCLLALGSAGTLYQVVMLRIFIPLEAIHRDRGFAALPGQVFQARSAFAQFDRIASRSAVVEFNPAGPVTDSDDVVSPYTFYARSMLLNAGRQILTAEPKCAAQFGGDSTSCAVLESSTLRLYELPAPSAQWAKDYCHQFGAEYLSVGDRDAVWSDPSGWAATLPAVASEPGFRIVHCTAP